MRFSIALLSLETTFFISPFFQRAQSLTEPLTREGVGNLTGYPGLIYQAIRFEPLCGNIGTDVRFSEPIDVHDRCEAAIEAFVNIPDAVAYYSEAGVRLESTRIAKGAELCMCFAMAQVVSDSFNGAVCVWADKSGQVERYWMGGGIKDILESSYRPYVEKALPVCDNNFDLQDAREAWSATALDLQTTSSISGTSTRITRTSSSFTTTITTTNSDGRVETSTQTDTGTTAVATETDPVLVQNDGGLSKSDKIALGVGLGIGIPTVLLAIFGLIVPFVIARRNRSRRMSHSQPMMEEGPTYGGIEHSRSE